MIELLKLTSLSVSPQVMNQAEGQQKNLVQSIESLPMRGPLSCLDQDLLLLKATSAATLSCLGECLSILQPAYSRAPPSGESNTDVLKTPGTPDREPVKDQGEVDCGPCPYLTGPMQLNVCNRCCWRAVFIFISHVVFSCLRVWTSFICIWIVFVGFFSSVPVCVLFQWKGLK